MMLKLFLLPLFLHVAMMVYVGGASLRSRIKSVLSGETKLADIAANSGAWPEDVRKLGNNFDNQFQSPMLWYSVSALVVALNKVDYLFVALSWLFLCTRIAHSYIHTGSNNVPLRMRVYLFGFFILVLMWLALAVRVLFLD
jgi:hypothetical protein